MSRYQPRIEMEELKQPSRCMKCLKFTWRTITCLFSHVALITVVVSYCTAGAFTFEALEVEYEKEVKRSIKGIRQNVSNHLWQLVLNSKVLDEVNFTRNASNLIHNFEGALVKAMTKDGWDGEEDENIVQWTRTGSLFYSIVVITTIGYGHICPKTPLGKLVTIFYALLGIPLMLICLSNIGDIMATSFRFLYWRVCCYVCTRPKKPKKIRSARSSVRSERFSRSRNASFRRSVRNSTRSADSGFGYQDHRHMTHSDTDLRYHDYGCRRTTSLPRKRVSQTSRYSDYTDRRGQSASRIPNRGGSLDSKKYQKKFGAQAEGLKLETFGNTPILCNRYHDCGCRRTTSLPRNRDSQTSRYSDYTDRRGQSAPRIPNRGGSLDSKKYQREFGAQVEGLKLETFNNTPILCNRCHDCGCRRTTSLPRNRDSQTSRYSDYTDRRGQSAHGIPNRGGSLDSKKCQKKFGAQVEGLKLETFGNTPILCNRYVVNENELGSNAIPGITLCEFEGQKRGGIKKAVDANHLQVPLQDHKEHEEDKPHHRRKKSPARMNPSPKMMTPLGYGYKSKYLDDPESDEEYYLDDFYYDVEKHRTRPVPIGLCVFLVISYIIGGAFLFDFWEGWGVLNSAYFCFITLTTIGFGDLVPAKGVGDRKQNNGTITTEVTVSIALCSLYLLFGISLLAMSFNLVQEEVITSVKSIAKTLGIIKSDDEDSEDDEV